MCITLAVAVAGCRGGATYTIVPLNTKRISTGEQLTLRIDADECYHWINDDGDLCVAMRMAERSILGKAFSRGSIASLVLGEVPASKGRNYVATRRTARFHNDAGYGHTRAASLRGIVGVWGYNQKAMQGRLRLVTVQQSYSVLTGWTGNLQVLYVGEFHSVLNRAKGEAILKETEEDGMQRQPQKGRPRRIQGPLPTKPARPEH